jgi:CheY-like chemotaxis protein
LRFAASRPAEARRADLAVSAIGNGVRVLIVDDNDDAAEMLADLVGSFGYLARAVYDGPSALVAAVQFEPDIAILDIGLPIMDGYELAARLRDHSTLSRTQLIAVSGYGQPQDRVRSAEVGFVAHLVKPVDLEQVRAVLDQLRQAGARTSG